MGFYGTAQDVPQAYAGNSIIVLYIKSASLLHFLCSVI